MHSDMKTKDDSLNQNQMTFSDKVLNFGMKDETWDRNLGDRYGLLRMGLWSAIVITGASIGISQYKKNQIDTLIADASKNRSKR